MPDLLDMPADVIAKDKELSASIIASLLNRGSVSLVLGAGASSGLGLPNWFELVQRCVETAFPDKIIPRDSSNRDLRLFVEQVENHYSDYQDYINVVHDALYRDIDYDMDGVIKQDLLIALGSLMMGSKRGSLRNIVTFNFDDVLEWYLYLHGFSCNIIDHLPPLTIDCDVNIYHPHGFIPKMKNIYPTNNYNSDPIVFSAKSYDERIGEENHPWRAVFKNLMKESYTIFVGISGKDPEIGPAISDVAKEIKLFRPTGFWFFNCPLSEEMFQYFIGRNVIPLVFDNDLDIPKFLLRVCQYAANNYHERFELVR